MILNCILYNFRMENENQLSQPENENKLSQPENENQLYQTENENLNNDSESKEEEEEDINSFENLAETAKESIEIIKSYFTNSYNKLSGLEIAAFIIPILAFYFLYK